MTENRIHRVISNDGTEIVGRVMDHQLSLSMGRWMMEPCSGNPLSPTWPTGSPAM